MAQYDVIVEARIRKTVRVEADNAFVASQTAQLQVASECPPEAIAFGDDEASAMFKMVECNRYDPPKPKPERTGQNPYPLGA